MSDQNNNQDSGIKQAYLMWIGKEHYPTISDWSGEAVTMGISKRLPNAEVGQALMEPGNVIFVAHDEGNYQECTACLGNIENPDRRLMESELSRLRKEQQALSDEGAVIASSHGLSEREMERHAAQGIPIPISPENQKKLDVIDRKIANRTKKIKKLVKDIEAMPKVVEGGTGGRVMVDGELWDYRKYNYHLHQPAAWNPDNHKIDKGMCEHCGGTGRLPLGQVFGLFVPNAVEYILKPEDGEDVKKQMEQERGFKTVDNTVVLTEAKRGCGKRKVGGVYVVTTKGQEPTQRAKDVVDALVKAGKVEPNGVEITGDFIRFIQPVDIHGVKRFRGLKKWGLDPRAEAEAEMILEAVA